MMKFRCRLCPVTGFSTNCPAPQHHLLTSQLKIAATPATPLHFLFLLPGSYLSRVAYGRKSTSKKPPNQAATARYNPLHPLATHGISVKNAPEHWLQAGTLAPNVENIGDIGADQSVLCRLESHLCRFERCLCRLEVPLCRLEVGLCQPEIGLCRPDLLARENRLSHEFTRTNANEDTMSHPLLFELSPFSGKRISLILLSKSARWRPMHGDAEVA